MTMNEFYNLCERYTIDPLIALENDNVVATLKNIRDTDSDSAKNGYRNILIQTLETEF